MKSLSLRVLRLFGEMGKDRLDLHVLFEAAAEIAISGKPLRATAGELVLMPAHQPHSPEALRRFKMLLTMIRS